MSASRSQKGKSSSGLRFLWIPGRKKHNHKGRYDSTRKHVDYSGRHKSTNEPWSLGGNKGFEKLIDSEIPGSPAEGPSRVLNALPVTFAAGASTTTAMKLDEGNQFSVLDDKEDKDSSNELDVKRNESSSPSKGDREENRNATKKDYDKSDRNDKHDGPDKKEKDNHKKVKDLNSIESIQEKKLKDSNFDITDSSLYLHKYNGKKKNKKKKNGNGEEDDDPDAATVKCLYYTLMCCECTIS